MGYEFDQDAVDAALNLFGRTGGKESAFGHTDPDAGPVTWWASVQYHNGERVTVMDQPEPVMALERLARRLINGAKCTHCLGTMTLSGEPREGICRWTRHGNRWVRGCVDSHPEKQLHIKARDFAPGESHA